MFSWVRRITITVFAISFLLSSFTYRVEAVACGGDCSVYACTAPLTCRASDTTCGNRYDTCSGAVNNRLCSNNNLWDVTAPCNGTGAPESYDTCTVVNTRRTATWGAFGTCSAACGSGNQTRTCSCGGTVNGCSVQCTDTDATGACNATDTQTCCVSQIPQTKPTVTSVGIGTCSKNIPMIVNWSFSNTGSTCNTSWGYNCSGNTNSFTIKVDGVVNTSNISSAARSLSINTTAAVSHLIQVCAQNGFGENCSSSYAVTIDTGPPPPQITPFFTPNPSCKEKYNVGITWNPVITTGCAPLAALPYRSQASSNDTFASLIFGWDEGWKNTLSQTLSESYIPGTNISFRAESKDTLDYVSGWSTTNTVTVPTPSLYPTIHIEGPLTEDINRTCFPMSLLRDLTLEPVIVPAIGVTPVCTMPTTDSYSCNITIDNQKGVCVSPDITVTMNATFSGYGTIGWRTGIGGGECTGNPTSRSYSATAVDTSDTNIPIFLAYDTILPTAEPTVTPGGPTVTPIAATPTPIIAGGWFKLKDTSFNSRKLNRTNYVPNVLQKYDTTADDSISNHNIMIGSSGLLFQNGTFDAGSNAYINGEQVYSQNNWYTTGYSALDTITYSKYLDYIKARKDFKTIEGTPTAGSFVEDGIYSVSEDVVLDATWFTKNIILVSQPGKKVTINTSTFIPTGSLAVVASSIEIDPIVTEIHAILIGSQVTLGASDVTSLKIKGNLIDEEESGINITRNRAVGAKPSLFVVFDIQMYMNILPYLSVSTYDWRQIQ